MTWIHSDHLQSATALTDMHGQALRRLAYRAYGEETLNAGAGDAPRHTYTGKEHDGTGLLYYGARYYDPALARFITPDTVYDSGTQGLNRYSYALNNPFRYNDPTGNAVNAAYNNSTPSSVFPYVSTIDTGSNVADYALGVLGGTWNLLAQIGNLPFDTYGATEQLYNTGTENVFGQQGLSGEGLTKDLVLLEAFGIPLGGIIEQTRLAGQYAKLKFAVKAADAVDDVKAAAISSADDMSLAANFGPKHDMAIIQAQSSLKNGINPAPSGYYDVVAHGTPYHMENAQGQLVGPKEVAKWIKSRPDYVHGTNVRLVSCWTGRVCNGLAQGVANELQVTVMAPTTRVLPMTLDLVPLDQMGAVLTKERWRFFTPQ